MGLIVLKIIPGAHEQRVTGKHGEAIKIKLRAPAMDGKANEALLVFLSKTLKVPRNEIQLLRGEKSRQKWIEIPSLSTIEIERQLLASDFD